MFWCYASVNLKERTWAIAHSISFFFCFFFSLKFDWSILLKYLSTLCFSSIYFIAYSNECSYIWFAGMKRKQALQRCNLPGIIPDIGTYISSLTVVSLGGLRLADRQRLMGLPGGLDWWFICFAFMLKQVVFQNCQEINNQWRNVILMGYSTFQWNQKFLFGHLQRSGMHHLPLSQPWTC